jgi:general secretion pathway protein F
MAVFEYVALDTRGKQTKGIIDAESPRTARSNLKAKGIYPTSIEETQAKEATKSKQFFNGRGAKVTSAQLGLATRQLATLVAAGMPLIDAMRALGDQIDVPRLKRVFSQVRDTVNEGETLANAMNSYPKVFPRLYVNMITAGEASGSLDIVLERLADLLENQAALKRKIISALTYPILMMFLCVGVIALLLTFVVPQITTIFQERNTILPLPTRIVIGLSEAAQSSLGLAAVALFAFGLIALQRYYDSENGKKKIHALILRMPLVGIVTLKIATGRFARNLGAMLASGVPLLQAMEIAKSIVGNVILEEAIEVAAEGVEEGKTLSSELDKAGLFPKMLIHMVAIGERSGSLEGMLDRVANTYESEVENLIAGLASIIEPIMIIFLACVVGGILGAVMLPMLELSSLSGLS